MCLNMTEPRVERGPSEYIRIDPIYICNPTRTVRLAAFLYLLGFPFGPVTYMKLMGCFVIELEWVVETAVERRSELTKKCCLIRRMGVLS
jgi:hypothetical protein